MTRREDCMECDGLGVIPEDDDEMRDCPWCTPDEPRVKTLRERILGSGAYYEGGTAVPLLIMGATWLAFRLDHCAHYLRIWGRRRHDSWGWGRRG